MVTVDPVALRRLADLAATARRDGRRRVLGIAGPPGAGKTTLVGSLLAAAAAHPEVLGRLGHVPMDGFHRVHSELVRLGRADRKGAPDTFDAAAYAAVLAAAREVPRRVVTAPAFDHAVGDPEPDAVTVDGDVEVVLTEGNYLLLGDAAWEPVRAQLDEVWFCALDDDLRRERLVRRHVSAGRPPVDARDWVHGSDEENARRVVPTAALAQLVLVDGQVVAPGLHA